jgi:hypothetical protein
VVEDPLRLMDNAVNPQVSPRKRNLQRQKREARTRQTTTTPPPLAPLAPLQYPTLHPTSLSH